MKWKDNNLLQNVNLSLNIYNILSNNFYCKILSVYFSGQKLSRDEYVNSFRLFNTITRIRLYTHFSGWTAYFHI